MDFYVPVYSIGDPWFPIILMAVSHVKNTVLCLLIYTASFFLELSLSELGSHHCGFKFSFFFFNILKMFFQARLADGFEYWH